MLSVMSLYQIPLDDLTLEHLSALVDNKVSESTTIEYKRDTYGSSDSDKKELIKDVSALANTRGGILFIGIDETDGCADALSPFNGNADIEIQRLNSILASSIEPMITGLEIRAIGTDQDNNIIIIKVPKSWSAPHRTNFKGTKRFYRRNTSGTYEPDVMELQKMFNANLEQENQFKRLRQQHVDAVSVGEAPVNMPEGKSGYLLLQIIPAQSLDTLEVLDLNAHDLRGTFRPLNGSGWDHRYNIDGFITFRTRFHAYTQLYRNGVIEAVVSSISRNARENSTRKIIAGSSISVDILGGTARYVKLLQDMNVQPPIRIYVSLLNVKNCRFATYHDRWGMDEDEVPNIGKTDVLLPPVDIMKLGNKFEIYESLRPIMDALWNADNSDRCDYYDENGKWTGHDQVRELGRQA